MTLTQHDANTETVSFGHVRLWLDDLEAIDKIIRDHYPDHECVIKGELHPPDRSYRRGRAFDAGSVTDLGELSETTVKELEVSYFAPREPTDRFPRMPSDPAKVKLILNDTNAVVTVREAISHDIGMARLIERVTAPRKAWICRPRPLRLLTFLAFTAAWGLLCGSVGAVMSKILVPTDNPARPFFVLFGATIVVGLVTWLLPTKSDFASATIHTRTYAEAQPFFERNRDNVIISLVSGVVGLVLGGIVGVVTTLILRD